MNSRTYTYDTNVAMSMGDGGTVFIHTTVTNSGDAVKRFLTEVRKTGGRSGGDGKPGLIVGLDTEWYMTRRGYRTAVLQLCVGHRCLVFQIVHADYVPATLRAFLESEYHRFVGVGVNGDAERLYLDRGIQVRTGTTVDLRVVAPEVLSRPELERAGLKALVLEVMGVVMAKPKHVTKSKWNGPLSPEQVEYAAIDAFVSYEVGRLLLTTERAQALEAEAAAAGRISPFLSFDLP